MKYSMEVLDRTTQLVFIIQEQLDCSFDEACAGSFCHALV